METSGSTLSESERRRELERAGFNVFRLPASAVTYECFTDVPHRLLVPANDRGQSDADPDEIAEALAPLTGDASLAFATKGRSAEIALVEALELKAPVVLTHGLFTTTQAALARVGAILEDLPLAAGEGSADVDLERLAARLGKGDVRIVYLELAHNAWYGWPLSEGNVSAVRELCDRHGATLLLDAARPRTNSAGLDEPDLAASARRILALAHAFTISCAKEFLVPYGSIVGSPDAALVGRVTQAVFKYGTSMSPVDPPSQRAELRDGVRYSLAHPELITDRLARVRALGARLAAHGLPVMGPICAHGVYVPIDKTLVPAGDVVAMITFFDHLYLVSGVRAQLAHAKRGPAIRLAAHLMHDRLDDAALDAIARGVVTTLEHADERPKLQVSSGQDATHPYFRRLTPA